MIFVNRLIAHSSDRRPSLFTSSILIAIASLITSAANANEQPPVGFTPAISTYVGPGMGNPERVWVKVTSKPVEKKITVWIPPSRQGAITNVYRGSCLKPGCIFMLDAEGLKPEYRRKELKSFSADRFTLGDWSYAYE